MSNYIKIAKEKNKIKKKVFEIGEVRLVLHGNSAKLMHDLENAKIEVGQYFLKQGLINKDTNSEEVQKILFEYVIGNKDEKVRDKILSMMFNNLFSLDEVESFKAIQDELEKNDIGKEASTQTIILLFNDVIEWIYSLNEKKETEEKSTDNPS